MNFQLTDDQRMLAETLEKFLRDNYPLDKRHAIAASEEGFSREMWAQFAELGVIGALFDERAGGFGGSGTDLMVVFEALGRALVVEPFLPTLVAGSLIAECGDDAQRAILEEIIAGETWVAFAHGEPDSRYELEQVSTRAEKAGSGWKVTGNKSVVLGGAAAGLLVVSARTSGETASPHGISLFLVDAKAAGVSMRSYGTVDGYPAAEIALDGAEGELLGGQDAAFDAIEAAVARGILALGAEALGAMEVAKDQTVEYMHTRKQFGIIIGKFQALQHRMADVLIELEQMRSALINAAAHLDGPRDTRERHAAAAKHLVGRIGRLVAEEAIQIHGGMGMTWEYPVGHYAKRITMIDHIFGDADHHLERYIALG
ncbi:MAG: acyl-CoA dehydrogenase family protein [Pseudomonadota bacterium]|nr:acyl-CoA dehydrogenase family protein [Pseudomonadota bacterium]MEC9369199.1 acyl-CoA dehydrogenase family protein [Pseudomonadota bacterium]